mmetsp:Transcript_41620/g.75495  ORF Transcript_41620/g.75495 Transcript_41620/m.75495 type:complete len:242 (+) Transcript_41620:64-789(+)
MRSETTVTGALWRFQPAVGNRRSLGLDGAVGVCAPWARTLGKWPMVWRLVRAAKRPDDVARLALLALGSSRCPSSGACNVAVEVLDRFLSGEALTPLLSPRLRLASAVFAPALSELLAALAEAPGEFFDGLSSTFIDFLLGRLIADASACDRSSLGSSATSFCSSFSFASRFVFSNSFCFSASSAEAMLLAPIHPLVAKRWSNSSRHSFSSSSSSWSVRTPWRSARARSKGRVMSRNSASS